MSEKPILFSGPMVKAILEGRKTQTRRVIKPQPDSRPGTECTRLLFKCRDGKTPLVDTAAEEAAFMCPYGLRGDRLWVRETHGIFSVDGSYVSVGYKARMPEGKTLADTDGGLDVIPVYDREQVYWAENHINCEKWRPSIFMPRWASRITLEIKDVRVERLQEISETDAIAEGITYHGSPTSQHILDRHFSKQFAEGWDKLNGKRAPWASNPWVWIIAFQRIQP